MFLGSHTFPYQSLLPYLMIIAYQLVNFKITQNDPFIIISTRKLFLIWYKEEEKTDNFQECTSHELPIKI